MATKEYGIKKQKNVSNDISDSYCSMNLTTGHSCQKLETVKQPSIGGSRDRKADSKNDSDFSKDDSRGSLSWRNSKTELSIQKMNAFEDGKKQKKNDSMNSDAKTINRSSTLSLHIAAYENSLEGESDNLVMEKKNGWKRPGAALPSFDNQNSFEFPRQQEGQNSKPEVLQFKASQKLLNPRNGESMSLDDLAMWISIGIAVASVLIVLICLCLQEGQRKKEFHGRMDRPDDEEVENDGLFGGHHDGEVRVIKTPDGKSKVFILKQQKHRPSPSSPETLSPLFAKDVDYEIIHDCFGIAIEAAEKSKYVIIQFASEQLRCGNNPSTESELAAFIINQLKYGLKQLCPDHSWILYGHFNEKMIQDHDGEALSVEHTELKRAIEIHFKEPLGLKVVAFTAHNDST